MPELPDLETFKRYLDATSLRQRIADVDALNADLLRGVSRRQLARQLKASVSNRAGATANICLYVPRTTYACGCILV